MIEYPADDIIKWSRSYKIRTLQNLEKLKRIYDKEKQQDISRLRPITDFFQVVARTTPRAPMAQQAPPPEAPQAPQAPPEN